MKRLIASCAAALFLVATASAQVRTSITFTDDFPSLATLEVLLFQPPTRTLVGEYNFAEDSEVDTLGANVVWFDAPVDSTVTGKWEVEWVYTVPGTADRLNVMDEIWVFPSWWVLDQYLGAQHGTGSWETN